jgi:hypothetical protein
MIPTIRSTAIMELGTSERVDHGPKSMIDAILGVGVGGGAIGRGRRG